MNYNVGCTERPVVESMKMQMNVKRFGLGSFDQIPLLLYKAFLEKAKEEFDNN